MDLVLTQALINYYAKEGYWRHVSRVCQDYISVKGEEPQFLFWKAVSLVKEGSTSEGIRDLELIIGKRDISLAATAALLFAHNSCKLVDNDAVDELTAQLTLEERSSTDTAFLQAANFYWHIGDYNKARDLVSQITEQQESFTQSQVLRGWIDLTCGRDTFVNKSLSYFDGVLGQTSGKKDLEAILGKAKFFEIKGKFTDAMDMLNQAIVTYPTFTPALVEKARVLMKSGDWDQALETAQRVYTQDPKNIDALVILIIYILVRECRYSAAASRINELAGVLDAKEPKNAPLYLKLARSFSRLSGQNMGLLQLTFAFVDRARKLDNENSDYLTEAGYEYTMMGDLTNGLAAFQLASQLDEANVSALNGIIRCQILQGQLEDAEQQLEFLNEIQQSIGRSAELAYLSALLAHKKNQPEEALMALDETVKMHFDSLKDSFPSLDYFYQLNPHFLVSVTKLYMEYCPSEPMDESDAPVATLEKAMSVLDILTRNVPGSLEGQLLLARMKFISNDNESAQHVITSCLRLDPTFAEGHLLAAQIALAQDNFKAASQELEQALSHSFEVREWPIFGLLQARVRSAMGELDNALTVLDHTLQNIRSTGRRKTAVRVSPHDKASIFLELANIYTKLNRAPEATKAISDAMNELRGSPEEGRVTISSARIALKRKDFETALGILRSVPATSPYFLKAKMEIANIYLQHKNDRVAYTKCYEELVESNPSIQALICLGEAYMNIFEPEKAIRVYEQALEKNKSDAVLATKIGKALVTTHDFTRAIDYYQNAVRNDPGKVYLRLELAELYLRLQKYVLAETALNEALASQKGEDVITLSNSVKILLLLAKVQQNAGNYDVSSATLVKARTIQTTVLGKMRGEPAEVIRLQRQIAANLCYQLGQLHDQMRQTDKAITFYNEALKQDETHDKSMLALARLHLNRGELDGCQQQCSALLRIDPAHEEATMMIADVLFRKNELDEALFHFQQLLDKKPNHYAVLVQFVQLLRRSGRLPEALKYFKLAEKTSPRAKLDAGLSYAKGIYHRYSNTPQEALKELQNARKDSEWGQHAIIHMIEIYLNPDNANIWAESDDAPAPTSAASATSDAYLKSAERLLKELASSRGVSRTRLDVLECYMLMATKQKPNLESALNKFVDILKPDPDSVAALTGMATALQMLKQTPKARNHLKRVAKMPYNQEEAEDFEKAYLLLADIYIQGGKYDLAQDLLKKALQNNKSCGRAWEFMGLIYEKEQSYQDAATCYENAWRMTNESDPGIGFKLAFNYLKAKKYIPTIDVCHKILAVNPNYPKIKKDVLEKARASLRP